MSDEPRTENEDGPRRWLDRALWEEHVKRVEKVERMATGHNIALFGHPDFPETGLLARFMTVERRVERMDRNQARWGGAIAVLAAGAPFLATYLLT